MGYSRLRWVTTGSVGYNRLRWVTTGYGELQQDYGGVITGYGELQ